jgi:murein L,D-transpeptidase YcbB/YkuD
LASVLALAPLQDLGGRPRATAADQAADLAVGKALRSELAAEDAEGFTSVYRERSYRPLWFAGLQPRPEAYALVTQLKQADADGLDPRAYGADRLAAALGRPRGESPADAARTELAISKAFAQYAVDLRSPPASAELLITDPALTRPLTAHTALQHASRAPSLTQHLSQLVPMNPVYQGLRAALAAYRAENPRTLQHDAYASRLRINLARARALPPYADARFVLVDAASAQLWLYENGEARETMPVAVGKLSQPTPLMAGMIRYAVFSPYWNVPPDLVRDSFAPRVLRRGPDYLATQRMEVLTDWSNQASVVDPATVDWAAVAAGRQTLRMRQLPGPSNMMGAVKLMLPNSLGVYLHDTPDKTVFTYEERTFSAGCVRLSDAMALVGRLLGRAPAAQPGGPPEQRVDLPEPIPVYIGYFTALPRPGGIALARDVYRRDAPLLAELDARAPAERILLAQR